MKSLVQYNPSWNSSKLLTSRTRLYHSFNLITHCLKCYVWIFVNIRDIDEVIQRANSTRYGLASGVFTSNIDTANMLTRGLRTGTVWLNCFDIFDAAIPFGGYKMSGIGREKGIYSLQSYLQVKAVVTPLKNPAWLWESQHCKCSTTIFCFAKSVSSSS